MDTDSPDGNSMEIESDVLKYQQTKLALLAEYDEWSKKNNNLIKLVSECLCEDGRVRLHFIMGKGKGFSLFCPLPYPNYEDNFFVEADPTLQLWCNTINEFILDSDSRLTLETVLYKAAALYCKNADNSPCNSCSSDSEGDPEDDMIVGEDSDEEWESILFQKKKQWRLKEAQLRAVTKQPKTSDMFEGSIKDHPKQVFSNSGASGILTNDLVGIMKSAKSTGINAEPIDDNIYRWAVFLSSFNPNGKLEQDLHQLHALYGYDYIQLQLDFAMDLYPFYPPIVKVVRPRLQGSMMLRVASLLKLSCWNPARDMKYVLQEIKNYLEIWARVDLNSKHNDLSCFPQAYFTIENHLLWLACVSEIPPRANRRFPEISEEILMSCSSNSDVNKEKYKNFFPAGTGFSSDFHKGWDINAFQAAKKEKDSQIGCVLQNIFEDLKNGCCSRVNEKVEYNIAGGTDDTYSSFSIPCCSNFSSSKEEKTQSNELIDHYLGHPVPVKFVGLCNKGFHAVNPSIKEVSSLKNEKMETEPHQNGISPVTDMEDLFNILEASSLVPFLEFKLQVDSFLEICQHTSLYQSIVDIIMEIASRPTLVPLLWNLPDQQQSIYSLVNRLEDKAKAILVRLGKTSANGNIPKSGSGGSGNGSLHETSEEEKLARSFYEMSQAVSTALKDAGLLTTSNSDSSELAPLLPDCVSNGSANLAQTYKEALKDMQFLSCDIEVEGANAHFFSSNFKVALPPNSAQVMRIAQEMAALSTALPLDLESAIFIRTDDAKFTLLKALIIGPEGTPYSGGCFQFDIFFPSKYPTTPPLVHLCTTGLGRVRFNPNLYANGIVCLSLLGTWKGLQGEQWHHTSTLLQVLISIQSLVLVAEPFFNEPGFETLLGTTEGARQSQSYNEEIRLHTIKHAMIGQLRRPSVGFEDVIRTHFRIKKNHILKEILSYLATHDSKELHNAFKSLKAELDKLTCPPESPMKSASPDFMTNGSSDISMNSPPEEVEPA
ncbi:uncharacterized protein [Anabrus simplex]|uniref:uncharacterized protein n=1 Tax=Anabrus simplex TaxID=316456 RepID=UPI0035A2DBE9